MSLSKQHSMTSAPSSSCCHFTSGHGVGHISSLKQQKETRSRSRLSWISLKSQLSRQNHPETDIYMTQTNAPNWLRGRKWMNTRKWGPLKRPNGCSGLDSSRRETWKKKKFLSLLKSDCCCLATLIKFNHWGTFICSWLQSVPCPLERSPQIMCVQPWYAEVYLSITPSINCSILFCHSLFLSDMRVGKMGKLNHFIRKYWYIALGQFSRGSSIIILMQKIQKSIFASAFIYSHVT